MDKWTIEFNFCGWDKDRVMMILQKEGISVAHIALGKMEVIRYLVDDIVICFNLVPERE